MEYSFVYNLVLPSALSPWLSNVPMTLQNPSRLQDHLFYGAFWLSKHYTVSLTSRKKDQREVEIFYWSSRNLCAFFVYLFCTCACPVYMHTHSRLLQCNKTHGSCEMSPLYYPQLLPGGAVALQSKTVWAACGTVSRSSISINPTELHPFLCTLHSRNNQVFDYSMDNSHFLLR